MNQSVRMSLPRKSNSGRVIRVFLLLSMFLVHFSISALAQVLFEEANELYREGKYAEAAAAYEEVARTKPGSEIYYNLGNAYFKGEKLGLAILNYERALRLAPRDRDTRTNLKYARELLEYEVEDKRNWHVWLASEFLTHVTLKECLFAVLVAYFVFNAACVVSIARKRKVVIGTLGYLVLGFTALCALATFLKYTNAGAGREAIVTSGKASARYGPSMSDRLAFRLAEGLTVSVKDEKPDWYRISLLDGKSGWVAQSKVTLV